jgi:hypothetical protein
MANQGFPPRIAADGRAMNSYLLSLRNLSRGDLELHLKAEKGKERASITPESLFLTAGEYRKVTVFVKMETVPSGGDIDLSVESGKGERRMVITKRVPFQAPES